MSANASSTATQEANTYDLQTEIWALKEELEDAKEIIDTNFARIASQAAQIHRLRQEIRSKNQLLDEGNKRYSEKLNQVEAEVASLKAALKQKDDDIKLKVTVANRGLRELLDGVEEHPSLSSEKEGANTTYQTTDSPSQEPSSRRKRKAEICKAGGESASENNNSLLAQAPLQKTSNAQMDERLAGVLDPSSSPPPPPPPPPPPSSTHAETTLEPPIPKRGARPLNSKRAKLSSAGLTQLTTHLPTSLYQATAAAAASKATVIASAHPSKTVASSNDGFGEREQEETEAMIIPRRGLRAKKVARGRDMF
ncbi:MAG: hypothetical protein Q9208_006394 [Pyrenodesmia sp. 3 TL-2023]